MLESLSKDLGSVLGRLSDDAVGGVVQREVQRVVIAERIDPAPLVDRAIEGVRRAALDELGALATKLRERLVEIDARTAALDERVTDARIRGVVDEATQAAADRVYRDEFERRIQELEEAFVGYGDQYEAIRRYVDAFKPGGLPVLQQERDELARRVEALVAERDGLVAQHGELRARLDDLETARRRQVLQTGVTPDEVARKLAEIEERQREHESEVRLKSERDRLAKQVGDLSAEVDRWRKQGASVEEARIEKREFERLQREVGEADDNRARTQNRLSQAESDRARLRADNEEKARKLAELEAVQAAAEARDQRLESLAAELGELSESHETAQRDVSQLRRDLTTSRDEARRLGLEIDRSKARETQLEVEWRKAHATEQAAALHTHRAALDAWAEKEAVSRAADHLARAERAEGQLAEVRHRLEETTKLAGALRLDGDQLRAEVQRLRAEQAAITASARKQVELHDEALAAHRARLEADIAVARDIAIERALAEATAERERLEAEADRFVDLARAEQAHSDKLAEDVMQQLGQKGEFEAQLEGLRRQIGDLAGKVLPSAERVAQLEHPVFRGDDLREVDAPSETAWLGEIATGLERAGFVFHRRLLEAFHTSLKVAHHAPLVILAGISGTGKSELPRLYADLGGLPFLPLAVQPSWDSPHDLFGFFNYTDGRLKAEPLARLLRQANQDEALRKSPSVILLDEMNLARVEYYFAELLSKLEARRGVRGSPDPDRRRRASVQVDAGPGEPPIDLYLDERVLFVGTMNEDESTLTLSDKVLDRSCVLTFPAPRRMRMTEQREAPRRSRRLSWETWLSWQKEQPPADIAEKLNAINTAMERIHRPFGHRLFRAIHAYIANHPVPEHGWDDQFAMKIIPRLRGLECGDRVVRDGLDELATHVPEVLSDAFEVARDREFFAWSGAAELYRTDA
jgi:hypothetical protein